MNWIGKFVGGENTRKYFVFFRHPRVDHKVYLYDFVERESLYQDFRYLPANILKYTSGDDYDVADGPDHKANFITEWDPDSQYYLEIIKYIFESGKFDRIEMS